MVVETQKQEFSAEERELLQAGHKDLFIIVDRQPGTLLVIDTAQKRFSGAKYTSAFKKLRERELIVLKAGTSYKLTTTGEELAECFQAEEYHPKGPFGSHLAYSFTANNRLLS